MPKIAPSDRLSRPPPRHKLPLIVVPLLLAAPAAARADVLLNSVTYTQATSDGTATEASEAGSNSPCCEVIFMAPGPFSSAPAYYNNTRASLSLDLAPGIYTFSGTFAVTGPASYGNVSLFFGASGTPGITAQAATTDSLSSIPAFSADGNTTLGLMSPWWLAGADSLTFDNGTSTATLTDFILATNTLLSSIGEPNVGSESLPPDGSSNIGLQFTLNVTNDEVAVPEPANLLALGPALALLMLGRIGRRRQAP